MLLRPSRIGALLVALALLMLLAVLPQSAPFHSDPHEAHDTEGVQLATHSPIPVTVPSGAGAARRPGDAWVGRLNTPTFLTRVGFRWALVDCWHHRVLMSPDLDAPVAQWSDLAVESGHGHAAVHHAAEYPHSMATDGVVALVESSVNGSDGRNHSVLVYDVGDGRSPLKFLEEIFLCEGQARRPHRVVYRDPEAAEADGPNGTTASALATDGVGAINGTKEAAGPRGHFYVYFTNPPFLARLSRRPGTRQVRADYCTVLPEVWGYARSLAVTKAGLLVSPAKGRVTLLRLGTPRKHRPVVGDPALLDVTGAVGYRVLRLTRGSNANDVQRIDGWYYVTTTYPCGMWRTLSLSPSAKVVDLTPLLGLCRHTPWKRSPDGAALGEGRCVGGTPYFVSYYGGRVFVPYIFSCSGVVSFVPHPNGTIADIRHHWGGGWTTHRDSEARRSVHSGGRF